MLTHAARAKGSGQSKSLTGIIRSHDSHWSVELNFLTGDARPRFFESQRQNALLEEQVRRARSVDGRLSTYNSTSIRNSNLYPRKHYLMLRPCSNQSPSRAACVSTWLGELRPSGAFCLRQNAQRAALRAAGQATSGKESKEQFPCRLIAIKIQVIGCSNQSPSRAPRAATRGA